MFTSKSFQNRIEDAGKIFVSAIEKLKTIQADITGRISENKTQIQKLTEENAELDSMKHKTDRQISEISKFIE